MNDLRAEIRVAFEKEQAPYPPPADLGPAVVRSVVTRPRRRVDRQWLAVVAALVIGVLVVVSLMSSRLVSRPAGHRPPVPVSDYGPPPAGEPLFYVGDPNHPGWYIGFDWNGAPRSTIKLSRPLDESTNLVQSPDGSAFYTDDRGVNYGPTLDRLGKPTVGFPVPTGLRQLVWADDNRHLCSVAWQNGNIMLSWHAPSVTETVAVVGKVSVVQPGISVGIVGCSFATDPRAVLEQDTGAGVPTDLWIVHLTDGKVLVHEKVGSGYANSFAASHDGTMVAMNSLGAPHTVVKDFATGTTIDLDPSFSVFAFSGDDRVVLGTTNGGPAGFPTRLEAIELATGKVLWQYDGGQELAGYFTEPNGAAWALMFKDPKSQELHPKVFVLMAFIYGRADLIPAIPGQFQRP
jgi:hypothetical protein